MCMTHRKQSVDLHIDADGTILGNVNTYDYLGFSMDSKVNMTSHVDKVVKKIGYRLHTLTLIRRFLTLKTALLTYKVMIMPHFDYVDIVLDSANKQYTDRLERLHKRAIRKIENKLTSDTKDSYDVLLKSYNLTTLYQRRAEHLLLFMFKTSKTDNDILNLQQPKIELRSRNKVKFKQPFTDKTKVQNSPFYRGIYLWNQLSHDIQVSNEISIFKAQVRSLFTAGQIQYMKGVK